MITRLTDPEIELWARIQQEKTRLLPKKTG